MQLRVPAGKGKDECRCPVVVLSLRRPQRASFYAGQLRQCAHAMDDRLSVAQRLARAVVKQSFPHSRCVPTLLHVMTAQSPELRGIPQPEQDCVAVVISFHEHGSGNRRVKGTHIGA
jgi:hypothetical protein